MARCYVLGCYDEPWENGDEFDDYFSGAETYVEEEDLLSDLVCLNEVGRHK